MQNKTFRTLDDGERRRVVAMMLATAKGAPADARSTRRGPGREVGRPGSARPRSRRPELAHRLVPFLLELPRRLGFRTAFCAAVAAWGIGLVVFLGCLEVVRW